MTYSQVKKPCPTGTSDLKSKINLGIQVRLDQQVGVKWLDYRVGERTRGEKSSPSPSQSYLTLLHSSPTCPNPIPAATSSLDQWARASRYICNWALKTLSSGSQILVLAQSSLWRKNPSSQFQLVPAEFSLCFCGLNSLVALSLIRNANS